MGKQQQSKNAIVRRQTPTSIVAPEHKEKAEIIVDFLQGFAAIDKRELTPELMDLYVKAICNYKPELSERQIEKGLKAYLETGDRWPWPAKLIELMEEEI